MNYCVMWNSSITLHRDLTIFSRAKRKLPHPFQIVSSVTNGAHIRFSFSSSSSCIQELANRRLIAVFNDSPIPSSNVKNDYDGTAPTNPLLKPFRTYALQAKGVTTPQSKGSGIGLVLYDPISKVELWSSRMYVYGHRNSLEAEYTAVIMGMDYASEVLGAKRLLVESSFHAIVHQITGKYTTKTPSLRWLLHEIQRVQRKLDDCAFYHIKSFADMIKAENLAYRALATRKSSNVVETEGWQIHQRDPVSDRFILPRLHSNHNPPVFPPDPPAAQSVEIDPSQQYLLQFDGGARSDFGIAGAGMVIYNQKESCRQEIWSGWYFHDEDVSNNTCEYVALLFGLKCALSMDIRKIVVEGDSLLVVRQMNGDYWTREESLMVLRDKAREAANAFEECEIRHIPRARNRRADWLAGHAMDKGESYGFDVLDHQSISTGRHNQKSVQTRAVNLNGVAINNRTSISSMSCSKRFFSCTPSQRQSRKLNSY
jgi:ribonuclease HI